MALLSFFAQAVTVVVVEVSFVVAPLDWRLDTINLPWHM